MKHTLTFAFFFSSAVVVLSERHRSAHLHRRHPGSIHLLSRRALKVNHQHQDSNVQPSTDVKPIHVFRVATDTYNTLPPGDPRAQAAMLAKVEPNHARVIEEDVLKTYDLPPKGALGHDFLEQAHEHAVDAVDSGKEGYVGRTLEQQTLYHDNMSMYHAAVGQNHADSGRLDEAEDHQRAAREHYANYLA